MTNITQSDRERAVDYLDNGSTFYPGCKMEKEILAGKRDELVITHTLARHREAETAALRAALKLAVTHIEHMAAWINEVQNKHGVRKGAYSFAALGEDLPSIRAAPSPEVKK